MWGFIGKSTNLEVSEMFVELQLGMGNEKNVHDIIRDVATRSIYSSMGKINESLERQLLRIKNEQSQQVIIALETAIRATDDTLWLIHLNKEPLYVTDCRKSLGQVFAFDEEGRNKLKQINELLKLFFPKDVIVMGENEVWKLELETKIKCRKLSATDFSNTRELLPNEKNYNEG